MKTLETDLTGANRENRAGRNFSVLSVASCSNPAVLGIVGPEDTTDISTLRVALKHFQGESQLGEIDRPL